MWVEGQENFYGEARIPQERGASQFLDFAIPTETEAIVVDMLHTRKIRQGLNCNKDL